MTEFDGKQDPATPSEQVDARNEPPIDAEVAQLREEARRELGSLAGHWQERLESLNLHDGGEVVEQRSLWADALHRFSRNRIAMIGLVLIVIYVLLAVFAPELSTKPATGTHYDQKLRSPSGEFWFGTDAAGRDLWIRAWLGARISLAVGLVASILILAIGLLYGAVSGYVGGRLDNAMMRLLDALYGLPYLPFAIIMVSVIRGLWPQLSPIWYVVPALTITSWFTAARIMRGQMLSLKQNEYVESARANGASGSRVIMRHVIPNALGVMVVAIFLEIPNAILGEAFLSFLGLGVQAPNTSWGKLANEGAAAYGVAPHMMWVPSLLIATTVLATVAIADGVRDALDPRGQIH